MDRQLSTLRGRRVEPDAEQGVGPAVTADSTEPAPQSLHMHADDFVKVTGFVDHCTSLGIFLDVAGRRVFIPGNCSATPSQTYQPGDPVTLLVVRRLAEREELVESRLGRQ